MTKFTGYIEAEITFDISNPAVIARGTEEEFRKTMYKFANAEEVLEHFADNAVRNGITYINELDGWADFEREDGRVIVSWSGNFTSDYYELGMDA